MAESKLREMSMDFAVKVIRLCETIKGHYSLVNQLECYETEYWLELFIRSEILSKDSATGLYTQCGTIRRMLIASCKTAKENGN